MQMKWTLPGRNQLLGEEGREESSSMASCYTSPPQSLVTDVCSLKKRYPEEGMSLL